jgi:hypothetical protein
MFGFTVTAKLPYSDIHASNYFDQNYWVFEIVTGGYPPLSIIEYESHNATVESGMVPSSSGNWGTPVGKSGSSCHDDNLSGSLHRTHFQSGLGTPPLTEAHVCSIGQTVAFFLDGLLIIPLVISHRLLITRDVL